MAKLSLAACTALAAVLTALAGSAAARETRCTRGDDAIRRVEIAAQDPNQNVPCEVVYWKDSEQPGVRNVLWTAQTDAAFCKRKADELVETYGVAGQRRAVGSPDQDQERVVAEHAVAHPAQQADLVPWFADDTGVLGEVDQHGQVGRIDVAVGGEGVVPAVVVQLRLPGPVGGDGGGA